MVLSDQIVNIMKAAAVSMSDEVLKNIAEFLVSQEIGISNLNDLGDVTCEIFDDIALPIPKIKRLQIIKAFSVYKQGSPQISLRSSPESRDPVVSQTPAIQLYQAGTSSMQGNQSNGNGGERRVEKDPTYFTYTVEWESLPSDIVSKLDEAKTEHKKPKPSEINDLKLAISKKVKTAYKGHRQLCPGAQKNPGRKIYSSLAAQVISRYGESVKEIINNREIGDGSAALAKAFERCIENMRSNSEGLAPPRSKVQRGKKVVGVLLDQHHPVVQNRIEQEAVKEAMQSYDSFLGWTEGEVKRDLNNCFPLIRDDIADLTAKIEKEVNQENNADKDGDDDEDNPQPAGVVSLKTGWPFLFHPFGLSHHYDRLTGKNIKGPMTDFVTNRLQNFIHFMVSCSSAKVDNLALRVKVESTHDMEPTYKMFLLAILMLAKHFKEEHENILLCVEKTTSLNGLELTILKEMQKPCIIALDHKLFGAERFLVCWDRTPLIESNDAIQAFSCLVQACFVFDLDYPDLPLSMEFVERYILGLGFMDSKIMKKGKQVVVITEKVASLIRDFEAFEADFMQKLQGVPY